MITPEILEPMETVAQLKAKLAEAEAKEREEKQQKRQVYEDLKNEAIEELCDTAIELNEYLKDFKNTAFESMQTLYAMLQEYSSRHADGKGNFRIEYGNKRVSYKRQGKATFDERSHQAEKHIIDFVNAKFENDVDTKDLVMSLLERKKGELDINLVQKLYAMEDRFQDENWKRGIELLKESYSYSHSKDYISFEVRNDKGEWLPINLQFSNI
ncbi:DUF3164 family protein [Flavobacterium columnare]|uniref:DUF3164 family protein n=1 Tax=Flavobacterium columnare TaxID=996 RepID=UPI002D2027E9|nr:DUF3164 family protein [Flavobacterium columnare]MEB3799833.1 DUF3164 family protein [Flavobacterium columnare]